MKTCYWDTSALIPSFLEEEGSSIVQSWLEGYSEASLFTSWLTPFEFESVLKRKRNQNHLTLKQYESIQNEWILFQSRLNFISLDIRSSRQGLRFQKLYGLKPYDSIQLGSASLIQLEYPEVSFFCLDTRLNQVARQESFIIPEDQ
jgi:predicted nucleic acid-binding protein